jgi:hypothetical protein
VYRSTARAGPSFEVSRQLPVVGCARIAFPVKADDC